VSHSLNRNAQRTDFDVLVVGGGMVGACFAAAAASDRELGTLRIALLDASPPARAPEDGAVDLRVSAVSRASERVLSSFGAWQRIAHAHRSAYTEMIVWDAAGKPFGDASLRFSASETSEPDLGHIVENRRLQWGIYTCDAFTQRVTLLRATLAELTLADEMAIATLDDGRRITASLVVGADGAASASRKLVGIETRGWSYEQRAFVTHVRTEQPHRDTAWQRFQPRGPIAFLPLADGRSSIVWTTDPQHAEQLVQGPVAAVAREIEEAIDGVLGTVTIDAARASFPLQLSHAQQYCKPRFVLVGDAAHAVHPLAGQGVNLGFLDTAALVETLGAELARSGAADSLAEMRVLRRYERWRKSENMLALGLIDGLNRLFSNASDSLGWVRRTGLSLVNGSAVTKRALMERAMGIAGDVPKLASGFHSSRQNR
jgi:2-polyprenylphenol 6-hydroxylase